MEKIEEGKWVQPKKRGYEFRINRSKVVVMDFRIKDGRVQFKIKQKD